MDSGENLKRRDLPTMQQISYLQELEIVGTERGFISLIAEKCMVTPGVVSRFLKGCIDNGYLTQRYHFTELGKTWLHGYQSTIESLTRYLQEIGIPQQDIEGNVRTLVENTELHTLTAMVNKHNEMKIGSIERRGRGLSDQLLAEIQSYEDCKVYFKFYRMGKCHRNHFSMANRGFEKVASVRSSGGQDFLELKIREMSANSRVHGHMMQGILDTLKYENEGRMDQAVIDAGRVRIPLQACRFHCGPGGEIIGMIPVTVTCNVGRIHMPESTAVLMFWL